MRTLGPTLTRSASEGCLTPCLGVGRRSFANIPRWRFGLVCVIALSVNFSSEQSAAEAPWKRAKAPLMTRWAKDVSPERVHPEYPRPQMVRAAWMNLNGLWQLAEAKEGEEPPIEMELGERILVPFPVESALSGVTRRAERLWYRRTFNLPADWRGPRTLLHFGAVDWEANVYVNGQRIGDHRGGYDPFSFDITDALRPSGQQELIVGVFDPTSSGNQPRGKQVNKPGGIYYTPSTGIWQTVWLEPVPAARIDALQIVPDVDSGSVRVTAKAVGITDSHWIVAEALAESRVVATAEGKVSDTLKLTTPDKRLWSPESPYLYDLRVKLAEESNAGDRILLDQVGSYFGMRKVEVRADEVGTKRIFVNDKSIFQVGPLDQGFWPDGLYTAPTDEALRYDLEMTKKLGFNMVRKHVKVEPARWYYWCDKLGLLVWQDMPSGEKSVAPGKGEITRTADSARQFETELERMITTLENHPSIIMWVVFNEGWGQYDTGRLTDWVKQRDPTRLVNSASGWNDLGTGDVLDIHAYPGPAAPEAESRRATVLGEFGGLGLPIEGHTWTGKTWGYRGTQSGRELTLRYEGLLRRAWKFNESPGISAAVYTQTTDVESEANGLLTYDREVLKVDLARVAAANRGQFPAVTSLLPTSAETQQLWRFSVERPADDWTEPDFDDHAWREGNGGFGTEGTPGAIIRTTWNTPDIWLRKTFDLPQRELGDVVLSVHHDEDVEIYINGIAAGREDRFTTGYVELPISDEARAALRSGTNTLAVHCHQTGGGQYIDVGLVELVVAAGHPATDQPPK